MSTLRVAQAQIATGADLDDNLRQVAEQTGWAAAAGARLVTFPEATMRAFGLPLAEIAQPLDGPWADGVRAIAARHDVVVVAGMFTPATDGRVTNTLLVTGPGVEASYDKIHVYDAFGYAESDAVAPGDDVVVVRVDGIGVGLATCYDVRFPDLFTALADRGAEVVCLPSSWGAGPGKLEQWQLLTRARALDSTCFVVATGQADPLTAGLLLPGRGNAPTGIGHSCVVGPDGTVLAELGAEEDLVVTELDLDEVARVRAVLPVLLNRRRDLG
ncbi:carbon-nitrogen hydrolase family protein [Microlunatus antarcticus]|uniref:Putative amidohydrolase n=1 Tax=Microlunatus antarcticus TaxID=53388 RepID=A0A7W5JWK7_9ACTN|nr:carbon-nitrogen hydrolase family protein [Microlunatus antarcticus]MBB3327615.1 putative amidohydrolase [Microlunatus antarcticus]